MMTEIKSTTTPPAMRKGLRVLLIGSLALNLLVVGIVGGGLLAGRGAPRPFGAAGMTLGPFAEALDRSDREVLGERLRNRPELSSARREGRDAAMAAFLAALRADPFDPATVEVIFADQRDRALAGLSAGQDELLSVVTSLSPERRLQFADRLEHRLGRRH